MTDTAAKAEIRPPGTVATACYAIGSFGTGVFSTVPTVLLLYFCTEVLHIPAAWAAATVFIPKVWAVGWDPFVGSWSDRTRTSFGRRRPFLIAGTVGVSIFFVAVFSVPQLEPLAALLWVSCAYFGLATLYSLFAVPYIAIPAEIGTTALARGRLVAWRMTVGMIGVLTGAGIAPLLVAAGGGGRSGYRYMSLCIAIACAVAMTGPILMMAGRERMQSSLDAETQPLLTRQIFLALRNLQFSRLALAYMLQLTAIGIVTSAAPYIVTYAFKHSEGDVGTALLAMLCATTISVPLWAWAGRQFGEKRALLVAALCFGIAATLLGATASQAAPWSMAIAAFAFAGIPFAGLQVLPFTILAHLVHAEGVGSFKAEGAFTGIWTASEKLGLAFGPAATGLALSFYQGEIALGVIRLVIVVPLVLTIASLPLFLTWGTRVPESPDLQS